MLEVNGKSFETDEEGYLANLSDWEEGLAIAMAEADDIELGPDHWEIINFLREYYEEYQIAPAVRVLTKAVGKKLGKDKGNSKYLYELFPYGLVPADTSLYLMLLVGLKYVYLVIPSLLCLCYFGLNRNAYDKNL